MVTLADALALLLAQTRRTQELAEALRTDAQGTQVRAAEIREQAQQGRTRAQRVRRQLHAEAPQMRR